MGELAAEKPPAPADNRNADIEKRIRDIDKQIARLMELYQRDDIPPDLLGDNINKLYNEKTALQAALEPVEEQESVSLDLARALLEDAAAVWDFADEAQKRRIMQSLIKKIVLTDDDIDIQWAI